MLDEHCCQKSHGCDDETFEGSGDDVASGRGLPGLGSIVGEVPVAVAGADDLLVLVHPTLAAFDGSQGAAVEGPQRDVL